MPAPAVIPAPRAYINAVAVKGFVVELRPVKFRVDQVPPSETGSVTVALAGREQPEKQVRGIETLETPAFPPSGPPLSRICACDARTGGRPRLLL